MIDSGSSNGERHGCQVSAQFRSWGADAVEKEKLRPYERPDGARAQT